MYLSRFEIQLPPMQLAEEWVVTCPAQALLMECSCHYCLWCLLHLERAPQLGAKLPRLHRYACLLSSPSRHTPPSSSARGDHERSKATCLVADLELWERK